VQTYDSKPKRRLFDVLAAQGMQANQQVTFLTDGGEDIRELPHYLNPQAEHLLDWFHITMRITVLTQLAKGLRVPPQLSATLAAELQRLKWFLWHGNVFRARQTIDDITTDLEDEDAGGQQDKDRRDKFAKAVREFGGYLAANASAIPNFGERYRAGEIISTSFVESAVNQVISKRMVKKQQMRWSPPGRAPTAPDPHPGTQRHPGRRLPALVPRLRPHRPAGASRVASHGLSRSHARPVATTPGAPGPNRLRCGSARPA
jgi:hypothetical protein